MSIFLKILVALIFPLVWNIITVIYIVYLARQKRLSPIKFSLGFILGFSITVSAILLVAISYANGITLQGAAFILLIFLLNSVIGFPVVYYLSRYLFKKPKFKWLSQ